MPLRLRALGLALSAVALTAGALLAPAASAAVPALDQRLDIDQGLAGGGGNHAPFGYLTSLTVNGNDLSPDYRVAATGAGDPSNTGRRVVSVLRQVSWGGGVTDPIRFQGVVSSGDAGVLRGLAGRRLPASVGFTVRQYDETAKSWFSAFESRGRTGSGGDAPVTAVVKDAAVDVQVSAQPSGAVSSPTSYDVTLSISPSPREQSLLVASSARNAVMRPWGQSGS